MTCLDEVCWFRIPQLANRLRSPRFVRWRVRDLFAVSVLRRVLVEANHRIQTQSMAETAGFFYQDAAAVEIAPFLTPGEDVFEVNFLSVDMGRSSLQPGEQFILERKNTVLEIVSKKRMKKPFLLP